MENDISNLENDISIQEGIFYTYVNPSKEKKVKYMEKEYDKPKLLPSLSLANINTIMRSTEKLAFVGITTDQQLYRPHKDVKVLITALNYPDASVRITVRKEGAFWLDDTINLSPTGLGMYTLLNIDIGKYDVSGEILINDNAIGIGTASFDVAVFELAPFQVIIKQQTMSKEQRLSANITASIFHQPYSGQLKVGLFCSYCRNVVLRDEITCLKGEGMVSFDVSGHTAPFSLEFIVPDRGYTAMIQLEGTMPHQRVLTPISSNLEQNYQMSLFPQTGSIAIQGINITPSEKTTGSKFKVDQIVMDEINIEITENIKYMGITVYNPIDQVITYLDYNDLKRGIVKKVLTGRSHIIVFLACVEKDTLFEAFFVGFKSINMLPRLNVPDTIEAGTSLTVEVNNPSHDKSEIFLIVFDKRKTHSSLYKAIGGHIHEHLKQNLIDLPTKLLENQRLREQKDKLVGDSSGSSTSEIDKQDIDVLRKGMLKKLRKVRSFQGIMASSDDTPTSLAQPSFTANYMMTLGSSFPPLSPAPSISTITSESKNSEQTEQALTMDIFEEFEDILYCETLVIDENTKKTINIDLANQITTWEIRMYTFQGLLFQETIKDIKAIKTKYIQIRAPEIIDVENGDSAEIEIHYLSDAQGTLEVLLDDKYLIAPTAIEAIEGKITTILAKHGMIRAILKTPKSQIECDKEVHLPFEQKLVYTHMVHVRPGEKYFSLQPVQIFPNPLPLIRGSVHALQGYPFGCAEQTSAKLGALALAYEYHKSIRSGEEHPLEGMLVQGMSRLMNLYYNSSLNEFGLWSSEQANVKVTIQILGNLAPAYKLLEFLHLNDYKISLDAAIKNLIEQNITSFDLLPYSSKFLPKNALTDPLEIALALIYSIEDIMNQNELLNTIQRLVVVESDECYWSSPLAWAGTLQTTCCVLQALISHNDDLSPELHELYDKGLKFVMKHMINGRLFSTTDTLALIRFFTSIPQQMVRIKMNDRFIEVLEPLTVTDEFEAESDVYIHWLETKLADPFALLPEGINPIELNLVKKDYKI